MAKQNTCRGVCVVEIWSVIKWTTWMFLLTHMFCDYECLEGRKFRGCPGRWWWQTLESEGHSPGSGHLWWVSSTQLLPAPPGPGCSSTPASFLSVFWPEPQLHLSSASSSLKLFLFSCKWAVYDDHYLNGLRWAPGCLSAADGLLIRWVSTPTGPGPKSGALLIMVP